MPTSPEQSFDLETYNTYRTSRVILYCWYHVIYPRVSYPIQEIACHRKIYDIAVSRRLNSHSQKSASSFAKFKNNRVHDGVTLASIALFFKTGEPMAISKILYGKDEFVITEQ